MFGLFSYYNNIVVVVNVVIFVNFVLIRLFVVLDVIDYIEDYLDDIKFFFVLLDVWDVQYKVLKDIGWVDWKGCMKEINIIVVIYSCFNIGYCSLQILFFKVV